MNIRGIANSVIQVTNPNISIKWVQSTGYTTNSAGRRTPTTSETTVQAQVQGLSGQDLQHAEGLNIQGVLRSVHLYGNAQGVVRVTGEGGDILKFPEIPGGTERSWKVVSVMETWPDWSRVLVQLQA